MVSCVMNCRGIARQQNLGILPRCLVLEDNREADGIGSIICGLNPARCNKSEQNYYIQHGATYDSVTEFWHTQICKISYYQKLRKLADALNFSGPILWTDTVKCEKQPQLQSFSHYSFPDTVRRCTANFLHRELAACPSDWIAIGVGRDAFATLSLVCPNRFVIGVPHCTGQHGARDKFDKLFDGNQLLPQVMKRFQDAKNSEPTGALWLSADNE
jgi:hypothetical protein